MSTSDKSNSSKRRQGRVAQKGHKHRQRGSSSNAEIDDRDDKGSRGQSDVSKASPSRGKPDSGDTAYWSSLSVLVAMACITANGSDAVAKKAADAVLDAGRKNHPTSLPSLATEVSLVIKEAGCERKVASAVRETIMSSKNALLIHPSWAKKATKAEDSKGRKESTEPDLIFQSTSSRNTVSPSASSKRRQLKEKEEEITQKTRALEVEELLILKEERELRDRMAEAERLEAERLNLWKGRKQLGRSNKYGSSKTSGDVSSTASMMSKRIQLIKQMAGDLQETELSNIAKAMSVEAPRHSKDRSNRRLKPAVNNGHRSLVDGPAKSRASGEVSTTSSVKAKRLQLLKKEDQISLKKDSVLEEAALNRQREKEIVNRMAELARLNKQMEQFLNAAEATLCDRNKNAQFTSNQNIQSTNQIFGKADTPSSDKTSVISNRTEDQSRRTGRSFRIPAITSAVSALSDMTGVGQSGQVINAQEQNQVLLNQALHTAMTHYLTEVAELSQDASSSQLR